MKETFAKIIFALVDIIGIVLSVMTAYLIRNAFDNYFPVEHTMAITHYLSFMPVYITILSIFAYEGIYTRRYDFWHEYHLMLKALFFSLIIVLAYLALSRTIEYYSRTVIVLSFVLMAGILPVLKLSIKYLLHRYGLWCKPVKIYAKDPFLHEEIVSNPYLGYRPARDSEDPKAVFINSKNKKLHELREQIDAELRKHHEVNFIPLLNDYDLTQSHIYGLFNTHTNLMVFQNRLKSRYRQIMQATFNYIVALLMLPFLLPLIALFAVLIKMESQGPIIFKQRRIGKDGRSINIYKFRSMYVDAADRLEKMLESSPEIREEWEKSFKLKNDPRITKVGAFLRKTSLDELPQIFNVLQGKMNFVGPRPVLQEEIDRYYKEYAEYYFMVKPGITGLWQVSGRSDTDYDFRVRIDKWYVVNWSLWLDIVIMIKTVRVVLKREGAY